MRIPKLVVHTDRTFVVLKVAQLKGDEIRYADICAIVTGRHILTVRQDEDDEDLHSHEAFRDRVRSTRSGADFILHAILDFVVNSYFPVVQMIEDDVLAMEQRLDTLFEKNEVTRLFRLRREAIQLQHVLTRMSDVAGKLANLDLPCIRAEVRPYFRDVHDQLVRLDGMISGLIDVTRAVFEAGSLLEQQRQGASTRKLAGWAAIFGAPAVIAGFFSMNFPSMPVLHSPTGYFVVVGVMLAICVGLFIRLKRLRWL